MTPSITVFDSSNIITFTAWIVDSNFSISNNYIKNYLENKNIIHGAIISPEHFIYFDGLRNNDWLVQKFPLHDIIPWSSMVWHVSFKNFIILSFKSWAEIIRQNIVPSNLTENAKNVILDLQAHILNNNIIEENRKELLS